MGPILDELFPEAARTRHNAAHLADLLPAAGRFSAAVTNPPFQVLEAICSRPSRPWRRVGG